MYIYIDVYIYTCIYHTYVYICIYDTSVYLQSRHVIGHAGGHIQGNGRRRTGSIKLTVSAGR